MAVVRAWR